MDTNLERSIAGVSNLDRKPNKWYQSLENSPLAEAKFRNHQGFTVLEAELTGILPGGPERRILSLMAQEGDPTNKIR